MLLALAKPRVATGVPKGFNAAKSTRHWYGVSFLSRPLRHGTMGLSAVGSKQ